MNCSYITAEAKRLSEMYGADPYEASAALGAVVSFKDLGSLKGAFFGNLPKPAIIINCELSKQMKQIVCAHELGHFLLHENMNFSCENITFASRSACGILEREANIFAAAFLIDSDKATDLLKQGYTSYEVASILNTDINLLLFLLHSIGICEAPDSTFLKKN